MCLLVVYMLRGERKVKDRVLKYYNLFIGIDEEEYCFGAKISSNRVEIKINGEECQTFYLY